MLIAAESYDYLTPGVNPNYNNQQLEALGYYNIVSQLVASTNTRFGYGKSLMWAGADNNTHAVWLWPNAPQPTEVYMGMAHYIEESEEFDHASIAFHCSTANSSVITLTFMPYGALRLSVGGLADNGTPLGDVIYTSPGGIWRLRTWFYVELGVIIDDDTVTPHGRVRLRFNTVEIADYIDVTTAPTGVTFADSTKWQLGSFSGGTKNVWWDDVYVCDSVTGPTGPANNFFLGNVRVQGLLPNATGANTDFTPFPTGPNWQAATNTAIDDTQYVQTKVVGDYDLYGINPIVNTPNVLAVQVKGAYKQDDATQRFAANTIKSGATQVDGASVALNQTYSFQWDILPYDPNTNLTWVYGDVNTIQIGPKVES